jgi:SAM-dependent methyltransferase
MSAGGFHRFSDVDASGQAPEFIAFLDRVRAQPGPMARRARTYDVLALQPGHRVLDAGCGLGDDTRELARIVDPGGEAVGVDVSAELLAEAERRNGLARATFVRAAVDELPFEDGSFDAYRAERLHQHLSDPAAAFAEAARVLRSGGRIAILDQDWGALMFDGDDRPLTRRIQDAFCDSLANGWAGRKLPRQLADAGFAAQSELHPGLAPVAILARAAADAALAAGAVDADEHAAWLAEQATRGLAGFTFVLAWGTKA